MNHLGDEVEIGDIGTDRVESVNTSSGLKLSR